MVDNGIEMVLSDGARISFQVEVEVRDPLLRAIKRGAKGCAALACATRRRPGRHRSPEVTMYVRVA